MPDNKTKKIVSIFCFVVLLGLIIPSFFLINSSGSISINFILLFIVVQWSTIRLTYMATKGQRKLTFLFFYVFIYVFLGIQPLISAWTNVYPHKELFIQKEVYTYTIIIVAIGIAAFEIGYMRIKLLQASSAHSFKLTKHVSPSLISINKLWVLIIVISGLTGVSIAVYGLNIYLSIRDGNSFNDVQTVGMSGTEAQLVINGIRALTAIVLFIALYVKKERRIVKVAPIKSVSLTIAIIFLALLNVFVSNPLNAPRLWSGSVILTSLFLSFSWNGTKSFFKWTVAVSTGLLMLFSGTDPRRIFAQTMMRGDEVNISSTIQSIGEGVASLPYDSNFDAFQMIAYTTLYTNKVGFSMGYQTLLPIFFWVPRNIWASKPIGSSDIVGEFAGFFNVNVSSPLWSEGYINFGIAGLILFLFIFGRCAALVDKVLSREGIQPAWPTIISSYFAANTFILLRGDLTSGTMYLQMIIAFSFIMVALVRKGKVN